LAWGTADDKVYGVRYNATGSVIGPQFQVNATTLIDTYVSEVTALTDGGFVVIWRTVASRQEIYGRHYDASGAATGSVFQVSTPNTNGYDPAVAALSNGGFVVVWMSGHEIYGQRYNASGAVSGSKFRVDTNDSVNCSEPTATTLQTAVFW